MEKSRLNSVSPLLAGLKKYRKEQFLGDLIAGLVVAIMLVPQAMAYAMLAGLPPQVGLYASIVPLLLYSFFGTSNSLAVGPVAMVSLLVVSGVGELANPGSAEFISLCLTLALLVGLIQVAMALLRLGFLVNFISHPVLVGFTSAAAIVIGMSQLSQLFGVPVERSEYPVEFMLSTLKAIPASNWVTVSLGLASSAVLVFFAYGFKPLLGNLGVKETVAATVSKAGPLFAVCLAAGAVYLLGLNDKYSVGIVGDIPSGLPGLTWPDLGLESIRALLPLALIITLVGYLESISVAKALASRKREKVDANRELFALGMADVGAAFTGGFPVTGGFSRSIVNFAAGVCTPMGSVITAILVTTSVLFLTPLFFYIPNAVLAAIIITAVVTLIDLKTPFELWKYSRADAFALLITFAAVLLIGIEKGIMVGIAATAVMLMWQTSRPHLAEVGRIHGTEHFRNILRHEVETLPSVLAIRIDESLYFSNAPFLESYVLEQIADRRELNTVLIIASGINNIDATGINVLNNLRKELANCNVRLILSDVKGPVTDRLELAQFDQDFMSCNVFLSADQALGTIDADVNHAVNKEPPVAKEKITAS